MPAALWFSDAVLAAVLLIAVATDLSSGRIYNWLTYPAALAGLVIWTVAGGIAGGWGGAGSGLLTSWLGLLAGFLPMLVVFHLGGIGGGDTKLAGAIGALVGWPVIIYALFYGFLAAAAVAVVVMIGRRVTGQTAGRIWRFLWLLATGARPGSPTDARSPRIATALPWALGTMLAVVERHVLHKTLLDVLLGH